jgi:hypothetical protein
MEAMFEFIFKINGKIPAVKEWFIRNRLKWSWLNDWALESKFPSNPMDQTNPLRIYKRRNNM